MPICGIYKITNQINGKYYIGQSVNIKRRWQEHCKFNSREQDAVIHQAFKKYGIENFSFEILEECSQNQLDDLEIKWIAYFDSQNPNKGYNCTSGGQGTSQCDIKLSKEQVLKIQDLLINSSLSQNDIAKQFNVSYQTISDINQGKSRIDDQQSYPLRKWSVQSIPCPLNREDLKREVYTKTFAELGRRFSVRPEVVSKWCKKYDLPYKKKEINSIPNEIWKQL